MKIAVSGASGLIGSALLSALKADGHEVLRMVRRKPTTPVPVVYWQPNGAVDPLALDGIEAVVHLAGESIGERWTPEKKQAIRDSRGPLTHKLAHSLAHGKMKPKVFLSASAVGYYGDRGDEVLKEDSAPGKGFLTEVAQEWEKGTQLATQAGIRTVCMRMGVVLSPEGGALKKMLTPFRMGVGGRLGNGRQWMSWVSLEDVVGAFRHVLTTDPLSGPVNVAAPNPVTNAEFTHTLGKVLKRPTVFPMPAFVVKTIFGEMGEALLLASQRVLPVKLQQSGYQFKHTNLEAALRDML
jgi:hypothetical protein